MESLVFMTYSVRTDIIDEFIEKDITSQEQTVCLDDLFEDDFIETEQDSLLIWSAKYIPREQFYENLNFLDNHNETKELI